MTKSLLTATLILFALMFASVAFATGWHDLPIIVKPPVVVAPPVVAPPVVAPPVAAAPAAPSAPPAPAQQPSASSGFNPGWVVMAGVAAYFWAAICVIERRDYPDSWFSKRMCFKVK